ncbi:MAG: OmpH family outer membrane protein [Myxococcales bacterium FL481]|nr:MAG: OmpH family outer membrane protein [Myxococcales bacterium FL481]
MRRLARVLFLSLPLSLGVASVVPSVSAAAGPGVRLALVDVQRCIMETKEGKTAKRDLEKVFSKNQSRLERKGKDLQKALDDLRAKSTMLSPAEVTRRQQQLARQDAELQQLYQKLSEELAQKEALLTERIYGRVAQIVKQIALEEKVEIVLVRSQATVLFARPSLDLTNRVILAYDKKHK